MSNKCDLRERLNRTIQYARRLEHDLQRREALMAKATKTSASMQDVYAVSPSNTLDQPGLVPGRGAGES